jgi:hypothetical protein
MSCITNGTDHLIFEPVRESYATVFVNKGNFQLIGGMTAVFQLLLGFEISFD